MKIHPDYLKIMADFPTHCCPECNGKGEVLDDEAIGKEMRFRRETTKLSLRETARRLGFSAAYISDLELGRRGWSSHRVNDYLNAISPDYKNPEPLQL